MEKSWYQPLANIVSLGRQVERPGSLAGLHEARREHGGQFFTPEPVAALLWRMVEPAMEKAATTRPGALISIFDNSVGSGRLLQFADPARHVLYGIDVHADSVQPLMEVAKAAGFEGEFMVGGMEEAKASGFDIALINPPFSVHLESPHITPYPCTTWGKYGPNSSTMSHAYAVHQALDAAALVLAILPRTYVDRELNELRKTERLLAVFHLPAGSFAEEGTDVQVSVAVFGPEQTDSPAPTLIQTLQTLDDELPEVLSTLRLPRHSRPRLKLQGLDPTTPSITLPVTSDRSVRVVHDGRKIGLRFKCGFTQARVLNAVLVAPVDPGFQHRYPREVRYQGQGRLDIEVHLMQEDPQASFESLLDTIRQAGGEPDVYPGLWGYFRRKIRKTQRGQVARRHTIYQEGGTAQQEKVTARARQAHVIDPTRWGSPVVHSGQVLEFQKDADGRYRAELGGAPYMLSTDELNKRFEVEAGGVEASGWALKHRGLAEAFPEMATMWAKRAARLGIDQWLSWQHQYDDTIESLIAPAGGVLAWSMALGKGRLSAGLCMLAGHQHNLVVVEAGLIDELVEEYEDLPLPVGSWQVIESASQLESLTTINIISYERLRMPRTPKGPRRHTYAAALRRRIGLLIADEGHCLSNPKSDQSRAVWQVSAKRRFVLTGTPLANLPKDAHPIIALTVGDGTAIQRYGYHRAYMESRFAHSMSYAARGLDQFREDFIVLEWVTAEYMEDNQSGGKREVPKLANIDAYRAWLAPHVKRRLPQEPEVAKHVKIPVPTREVVKIRWDDAHLAHYLEIAEEFANRFMEHLRAKECGQRISNMVALLARFGAVHLAANYPQHGVTDFAPYHPLTSKQRWILEKTQELTETGHKTLVYVDNPGNVELLVRQLAERNIAAVPFHGQISPRRRMRELNRRFRKGSDPVAIMTFGSGQAGLNIPQADRVILGNRRWNAKSEEQAVARVLRSAQKRPVKVYVPELIGSIDMYQAQMVAFKKDAATAGLDYGTPEFADVDFLHMDTIFRRFCEDLAALRGCNASELRQTLAAA